MRLLQYINEEYVTTAKPTLGTKDVSIFRNPSMKELKEALDNDSGSCRFYIDLKNKDFYVWDYRLLHEYARDEFGQQKIQCRYPYNGMNGMWGEADSRGNKLVLNYMYSATVVDGLKNRTPANRGNFLDNLKFVDKYFENNDISSSIRESIREMLIGAVT
jgi:hypothetical protein